MSTRLNEAFKKLEAIDQDIFDVDKEGLKKLDAFLDGDEDVNVSVFVEPEETTKEENYIGKVLCRCVVCHSDIMKDKEEIVVEEDDPEIVNCGDECPMCQSVDGYNIIGCIAPYEAKEVETNKEVVEEGVKDVLKGETSIAHVLNIPENKARMNAAGSDIEALKAVVLDILENSEELKNNSEVENAKRILTHCHGLKFVTTLATYMTGLKTISNKKYDNALKESVGTTYDAVLKVLDDNGYDVTDSEVKEYAFSAADYIEFSRSQGDMEDYTVEQWFNDTRSNYPEDLANLKRVDDSFAAGDLAKHQESAGTTYDEVLKVLDDNGYDVEDAEVKDYATSAAQYIEYSRIQDEMEEYSAEEWFNETKLNYPEDLADLKRVDESFVANDLAKYQEWVDFDMKKYGRISEITQSKLDKAGLEVVKDDHGDYEVIAKENNGKAINECANSVEVKTEDQKIEITQEEGKTVVEVSTENEEAEEDTYDEFDEVAFDELCEGYLKRVYENVESFKTSKGAVNGKEIILEGVITFTSGKKASTTFLFESAPKTKSGKLKFIGENKQLTENKAFTLTAHAEGKKLCLESLNYKYSVKNPDGKAQQLYGTIKR